MSGRTKKNGIMTMSAATNGESAVDEGDDDGRVAARPRRWSCPAGCESVDSSSSRRARSALGALDQVRAVEARTRRCSTAVVRMSDEDGRGPVDAAEVAADEHAERGERRRRRRS